MENQATQQATQTTTPTPAKVAYHAVLWSPSQNTHVFATAARKVQLRKEVAEKYSDCDVVKLYRGREIDHKVEQRIQF